MGIRIRNRSTALLRPFIFFHSSSPTAARAASSTACLQLQLQRCHVATTTTTTTTAIHRRPCRVHSSSDYSFSLGAPARDLHYQQRSGSESPSHNQHHQLHPTPIILLLPTTTRRSSSSSNNNSNDNNNNNSNDNNIVISVEELQSNILRLAKSMSISLARHGYWTNHQSPFHDIVPPHVIATLRKQAISLRNEGRYEPSYSESIINPHTGETVRFDKPGVYACEPDGADYETAPDMLLYMTILLQTLPTALNNAANNNNIHTRNCISHDWKLDNTAFNAKLAVTQSGGSKYPRHVDNVHGIHVGSNDMRKLTAILYLNPDWTSGDGGELRLYLQQQPSNKESSTDGKEKEEGKIIGGESFVDLSPVGGRLVLFYSDEIPHEVLENAPHAQVEDDKFDRYALTIWIPASLTE